MKPYPVALLCVLALSAAPAAANEVLLAGTPQYPTAQAAVDAASDGDIIRFGLGAQGEVVIDGKGVTAPIVLSPEVFKPKAAVQAPRAPGAAQ